MLQTIAHTLDIGDHVAYWHNGESRTGTIRYFTGNRKAAFIRDDITKEIQQISTHLVVYQPLELAA